MNSDSSAYINEKAPWLPQASMGLYLIILLSEIGSEFLQKNFFNINVALPILTLCGIGLLLYVLQSIWESFPTAFIMHMNACVASFMVYFSYSQLNLFLLLYFVNLIVGSLIFSPEKSLRLALTTCVFFNISILLSNDFHPGNLLFFILINNFSFFAITAMSGFLSQQLNQAGLGLRALKNLHTMILNRIPLGIALLDENKKVVETNPWLTNLIGNSEQIRDWVLAENFSHRKGQEKTYNNHHLRVGTTASEFSGLSGQILVVEDITDLKETQFRLQQEEKMAAVGKLAAGIAHEIRNPLASISGSVQMLSQSMASEEDRKLFRIVIKETDRLNDLITEFLDYARPMQPSEDPVDLGQMIDEILEFLQHNSALNKAVKIEKNIIPYSIIRGSKGKLRQAFMNLIINGFQAMQPKVLLVDETSSVPQVLHIRSEFKEGQVLVHIRDSGCGMTDEVKRRLFEPFFTTKVKGTGLGLAVTHKIIEVHGGQLLVESELNSFTEFVIALPRFDRL